MYGSLRQVKRTVGKWAWLCPLLAIVLAAWLLTVWGFTFWSALLAAVLLVCPALVLWGRVRARSGPAREMTVEGTTKTWIQFARGYLVTITLGHLLWEILQLPLYTIWHDSSIARIAFAVVHCTVGDILIGASTLAIGVLIFGRYAGPQQRGAYNRVAVMTTGSAVIYTFLSEWHNTQFADNWAYSPLMPLVSPLNVGLAPLLQWALIPAVTFWLRRPRENSGTASFSSSSLNDSR